MDYTVQLTIVVLSFVISVMACGTFLLVCSMDVNEFQLRRVVRQFWS